MEMNTGSARASTEGAEEALHLPGAVCRSFEDQSAAIEGSPQVADRNYVAAAGPQIGQQLLGCLLLGKG